MKIVRVALENEWSQLARLDTESEGEENQVSPLLENAARQTIVALLADKLPDVELKNDALPLMGITIGRLTAESIGSNRVRVIELRSLHQALICHTIINDSVRAESLNPSTAYLKDLQVRLETINSMMAQARHSASIVNESSSADRDYAPDNNNSSESAKRKRDPLGTLSHRVRTPLQAAKLRTELLALELESGNKEREELNGVLRSLDEAIKILNKYTLRQYPVSLRPDT